MSIVTGTDIANFKLQRVLYVDIGKQIISAIVMDDERERSHRRSEAELSRLSNSFLHSSFSTDEEIKTHFNLCLKMHAENKISVKNAWSLKLIDYMQTVLLLRGESKRALQLGGTSLEAGSKIYGIRVDDIHSNTLKLAGNMARTNATDKEGTVPEGNEEVAEGSQQQQNKRNKRPKTTVTRDISTLVGDIPKLPSTFFNTSAETDLVASNLLSSTLPMHYAGYKFMLLSKEPGWISSAQKPLTIANKKYPIQINNLNKVKLCLPFEGFEIDDWDTENELNWHNDPVEAENVVAFNEEGEPIPELDGTIPQILEFYGEPIVNQRKNETVYEDNVIKYNRNDYFYLNPKCILGNKTVTYLWAGPSHWKFKHIERSCSRFSGRFVENNRAKGRKYVPEAINFMDDGKPVNKTKLCKKKHTSSDEDYIKCTLPEKFLFKHNINEPLITKPLCICENNVDILKEPDVVNEDQNHELSFQNEDFDNVSIHEETRNPHQRELHQENLIDAPEMVQNIFIPYALHAKQMDMKKLKRAIEKTLTAESDEVQAIQKRKFSEVYQEVPEHLSKKHRNELSCPLAFVALLHLANENNLHFTEIENQNDFYIEKKDYFE